MKTSLLISMATRIFLLAICLITFTGSNAQIIGWAQVPSPNPGPDRSQLRGISGTSSTDIWAVGHYQTSPVGQQYRASNLITHWNGSTWQMFPPLDPTNVNNDLFDVEAVDSNNVWACGFAGTAAQPQLLHYNGSAWSQVSIPITANTSYLNSLDAISANDVWAVGGRSPVGTTLPYPVYALHYNGSSWTEVSVTPLGNGRHEFAAVDGVASNDVWAVGYWGTTPTTADARFLAMHWNGSTWVNMNSTLPASVNGQMGYFTNLKMLAPNDVWAIGSYTAGGYVMLHYDGNTWTEVAHPLTSASLAGTSSGGLYSFGMEINYWDGSAWSTEDSLAQQPNPAFASSVRLANGDIWAAGRTIDANNVFRTLVYRSVSSPPTFANGSRQQWQALSNTANSLDNLLITSDSDVAQVLTYRVVQAPLHGTLTGLPATAVARNGVAQPANINYSPAASFNGIDSFNIEVSAGSISARTTIVTNVVSALPVSLTEFTANPTAQGVLLKWNTAQEINTSHFTLEHSVDGRSFTTIATLNAAGNSTAGVQYGFLHKEPKKGVNYYRLILMDRDGRRTIFPVRMVTMNAQLTSLSIYANPANSFVSVSHSGADKGTINIIDQSGRIVKTVRFAGTASTLLDVTELSRGMYVLRLVDRNGMTTTGKLVKN